MEEEFAFMAKYQVWDVVEEPPDKNIAGSRWVFRSNVTQTEVS